MTSAKRRLTAGISHGELENKGREQQKPSAATAGATDQPSECGET